MRSTKVASESRGPSRINYAVVYPAIVVLGVLTGVLGTVLFPMDWGPDDWISLSVGVFTTMAVAVVAQRQDAIRGATEMKRKSSEDAFASLDFQEKLGVIEANAYRTAGMDPDWCMYVASDARAAMYVFEYVDADQQSNYLSAVGAAFRSMNIHFSRALEDAAASNRLAELTSTIRIDVSHLLKRFDAIAQRDGSKGNDALHGAINEVRAFDEHFLSGAVNSRSEELVLGTIQFSSFERLFRENVRVLLDWDFLRKLAPVVKMSIIGERGYGVLRELHTPWYATDIENDAYMKRLPCLQVKELAGARQSFSAHRVKAIEKVGRWLGPSPSIQTIVVYNTGSARLVLDGNHRLASMSFRDHWSPVLVVEVKGPATTTDGRFVEADLQNLPSPGV